MISWKIPVIVLGSVFSLGSASYGLINVRSNAAVNSEIREASVLASSGNYSEALNILNQIQPPTLTSESTLKTIEAKKTEYQNLSESAENFEQGRKKYESSEYSLAIISFNRVIKSDANYINAQNWILLAENKLTELEKNEPKASVASINSEIKIKTNESDKVSTQAIVTSTKSLESTKSQTLKNLFTKLGKLSGSVIGYQYAMQESAKAYGSSKTTEDSYQSMIDSANNEMQEIKDRIVEITNNCDSQECANALQALSQLQLEGKL